MTEFGVDISTNPKPPIDSQAYRVVGIFEEAIALFLEKNSGYGDRSAYNLGAMGQFADMNRKMEKLRHILWEGNEAVGESVEEVLQDLMGHCALTIDFIQKGRIK